MKGRRWFRYLLVVFLLSCGVIRFAVQRVDLYGSSMEPAYSQGDVFLVDKLSVYFDNIDRYDVVAFRYRYHNGEIYVKRVIGLPGETVQIIEGRVWIDGRLLEDDMGTDLIKEPRRAAKPVLLGEDEYFVLGDNRNDSSDSRDSDIADVSKSQLIGKVIMRMWHKEKDRTDEKIK